MAHIEQLDFVRHVRDKFPAAFSGKRVLEIGSLIVNDTVRGFFGNCDYTGIDVAAGEGVDIVCQGQDFDAPDASFDTVICCEVLEHNPHWKETFENMIRLCRPGGLILMTCATTGRAEHGTTRTTPGSSPLTVGIGWEYYRNLTARDIEGVIDFPKFVSAYRFYYNFLSSDLYFAGFRSEAATPEGAEGTFRAMGLRYTWIPYALRRLRRLFPNQDLERLRAIRPL